MSITAHNYDACRKKAAELSGGDASKLPVLQYRGGGKTVLLPKGQQVTLERFTQGPRKLTGKQLRRQRILMKQQKVVLMESPIKFNAAVTQS